MRRLYVLLAICLTAMAAACLNDRDTVAAEARRYPDTIWTIVGRFERNPPLYYQMRIDRTSRDLAANPARLELYDDIAVACDRLHRDEEALRWIERKRTHLPPLNWKAIDLRNQNEQAHGFSSSVPQAMKLSAVEEQWYRYYANAGTFHAHHWIQVRKTASLHELEQAIHLIHSALRINPAAHFGRERYQLAALQWMETAQPGHAPPEAFAHSKSLGDLRGQTRDIAGLEGLVRLGGAWESPDVFDALAVTLLLQNKRGLGLYAHWRSEELEAAGHDPLGPLSTVPYRDDYMSDFDREEFARLPAEADLWIAERTSFMMAKLKQGKHPDTDSSFWVGYVERPLPKLRQPPIWVTARKLPWPSILTLACASTLGVAFILRRGRRRSKGTESEAPAYPPSVFHRQWCTRNVRRIALPTAISTAAGATCACRTAC